MQKLFGKEKKVFTWRLFSVCMDYAWIIHYAWIFSTVYLMVTTLFFFFTTLFRHWI